MFIDDDVAKQGSSKSSGTAKVAQAKSRGAGKSAGRLKSPEMVVKSTGKDKSIRVKPSSAKGRRLGPVFTGDPQPAMASRCWPTEVTGDRFAIPDIFGKFTDCDACISAGNNKHGQRIQARHRFCKVNWLDHVGSKKHKENVANILARKEKEKKDGKKKKVATRMQGYFKVVPKKNTRGIQRASGIPSQPAAIDLTTKQPRILT